MKSKLILLLVVVRMKHNFVILHDVIDSNGRRIMQMHVEALSSVCQMCAALVHVWKLYVSAVMIPVYRNIDVGSGGLCADNPGCSLSADRLQNLQVLSTQLAPAISQWESTLIELDISCACSH